MGCSLIKSCVREYPNHSGCRHFFPSGARLTRSGLPYASDEWRALNLDRESEPRGFPPLVVLDSLERCLRDRSSSTLHDNPLHPAHPTDVRWPRGCAFEVSYTCVFGRRGASIRGGGR